MDDQVAPVGVTAASAGTGAHQPYLHELASAVCAPAMSLSSRDGQIRARGAEGLYVQDLRALSELVVTIDGAEPVFLGAELEGGPDNEFHAVAVGLGNAGPDPTFFVLRQRVLNPSGMLEQLALRSYARSQVDCRVEVRLACDLARIELVKAGFRPAGLPAALSGDGFTWELPHGCSVGATATPKPSELSPTSGTFAWDISVPAYGTVSLSVAVGLQGQPSGLRVVAAQPEGGSRGLSELEISAEDLRLAKLVKRSLADIASLRMALRDSPEDDFVAAGAPWYLTLFGRDSIWCARMLLPLGTELALGTLRSLAHYQGHVSCPGTDEEEGKILHELRRDETSHSISGRPDGRAMRLPPVYYGTIDATLLWVCLLHEAWKWGAPARDVEALLPAMQGCLRWLAGVAGGAGGFVEYVNEPGQGISNQGWKDSRDAVQFRDGHFARPPIALCEVQAYAYQAATAGAELLVSFGLDGADEWREFASALAGRFRRYFWVEDAEGPYPAMALEKDGTPVDSLSSNIGHLLGCGILNAEESDVVARRLGAPDLDCGFGLRTLGASSAGYNPVSYHCGSVWAHDTGIAVRGLARTPGAVARATALSLIEGLLRAAEGFGYRLPELHAGYQRRGLEAPLPYPAACHPQGWSAAAAVGIVPALLGIEPDVPAGKVRLDPLPSTLGLRRVSGLRLAGESVSVEVGEDGQAAMTGLPTRLQVIGS